MTSIAIYFALSEAPSAGTTIASTFGPVSGTANPTKLPTVPGNTSANGPIPALGVQIPLGGPTAPKPFALTVLGTDVHAALAIKKDGQTRLDPSKIEDIVLVIDYTIS